MRFLGDFSRDVGRSWGDPRKARFGMLRQLGCLEIQKASICASEGFLLCFCTVWLDAKLLFLVQHVGRQIWKLWLESLFAGCFADIIWHFEELLVSYTFSSRSTRMGLLPGFIFFFSSSRLRDQVFLGVPKVGNCGACCFSGWSMERAWSDIRGWWTEALWVEALNFKTPCATFRFSLDALCHRHAVATDMPGQPRLFHLQTAGRSSRARCIHIAEHVFCTWEGAKRWEN